MLDLKTNISCVLESVFAGFKDENIEIATENITKLYANELEKIKAEIKEEQKRILTLDNGQYYVALCDFQKLLDNHISELKGEQK